MIISPFTNQKEGTENLKHCYLKFDYLYGIVILLSFVFEYMYSYFNLSCYIRKSVICICKNKGADQLCSNCTADQHLCFRYTDSTIPLLIKAEISSFYDCISILYQTWLEHSLLVFPCSLFYFLDLSEDGEREQPKGVQVSLRYRHHA